MKIKKMLLATGLVFMSMGAVPAFSQIHVGLGIHLAPPREQHEVRGVRPDRQSVWIGGSHEWNTTRNEYAWTPGRWDHPPRRGASWVAPRWQRRHGEYVYYQGRWK